MAQPQRTATNKLAIQKRMLQHLAVELGTKVQDATPVANADASVAALVRAFQQQQGLPTSGLLDKATCWLLRQRAAERAGARVLPGHKLPILIGLAEEERFYFYLRYMAAVGDDARDLWPEFQANRRIILGLRVPTNTRSRDGKGVYDDRLVVLWYDGAGRCAEFEANTDPSSRYEDGYEHSDKKKATTKDANEDGVGDLGRLPYGVYQFKKEASEHYGNILRPAQAITSERDTDHNGWFGGRDLVSRRKALNSGKSILFHRGGTQITGSAACQTLRPTIFNAFFRALGDQQQFFYLLVPATEAWSKSVPPLLNLPMDVVV